MKKEYEARFDLRVDSSLKRRFNRYCKDHKLKISEAGRDALTQFLNHNTLIDTLIENIQGQDFFDLFYRFYHCSPEKVREALNEIMGPAEESLVKNTPQPLLKSLKVVTTRGQAALKDLG